MTIRTWIDQIEMIGRTTFSIGDVLEAFPSLGRQVVQNNLMRLKREKRIVSVYRCFYVITPVRYKSRGIVPPTYYVPELMQYLKRPYYFSLLSAAKVWGASHQAAHIDFVTTLYPDLNSSRGMNADIHWCYRYNMPSGFLVERKESDRRVLYSSPELTAVELVQYARHCGGLSNVATVAAELVDALDFEKLPKEFFDYCEGASIQRLGYLLEEVVGEKAAADALYVKWRENFSAANVRLSVLSKEASFAHCRRWHIDINEKLEVDDL